MAKIVSEQICIDKESFEKFTKENIDKIFS